MPPGCRSTRCSSSCKSKAIVLLANLPALVVSSAAAAAQSLASPRHSSLINSSPAMAGGPYSGTSTLALVARISAVSVGVVYGSMKLAYLKARAPAPVKH